MISFVNGYYVVLDACVLAPMPICAVLLQLASEPALFVPKWSDCILGEVRTTLAKPSFGLSPEQIDRRISFMRTHFEEALVTGYESLTPAMECDAKDRHVLAAAVRCEADAIVTNNIRDFPRQALEPYGIELMTADQFLTHQYTLVLTHQYTLANDVVKEKRDDLARMRNWDVQQLVGRLSIMTPRFASLILGS